MNSKTLLAFLALTCFSAIPLSTAEELPGKTQSAPAAASPSAKPEPQAQDCPDCPATKKPAVCASCPTTSATTTTTSATTTVATKASSDCADSPAVKKSAACVECPTTSATTTVAAKTSSDCAACVDCPTTSATTTVAAKTSSDCAACVDCPTASATTAVAAKTSSDCAGCPDSKSCADCPDCPASVSAAQDDPWADSGSPLDPHARLFHLAEAVRHLHMAGLTEEAARVQSQAHLLHEELAYQIRMHHEAARIREEALQEVHAARDQSGKEFLGAISELQLQIHQLGEAVKNLSPSASSVQSAPARQRPSKKQL